MFENENRNPIPVEAVNIKPRHFLLDPGFKTAETSIWPANKIFEYQNYRFIYQTDPVP